MADPLITLQQQVKCPVCLDVFTQPKLLVCHHAFCQHCIDQLPVDVDHGDHTVKCPTCRKQTTLPQHDAANLPPAFYINNLIELHQMTNLLVTKHVQEIDDLLLTVKQQVNATLNDLNDLNIHKRDITRQGELIKEQIDTLVYQIITTVQQSGRQLKDDIDNLVRQQMSQIATQKEQGETLLVQTQSCVKYVEEKIYRSQQNEILLEKNELIERLKAVSQELKQEGLRLKEKSSIEFQQSCDILEKCSKIGKIDIDGVVTSTTSTLSSYIASSSTDEGPQAKLGGRVAIVGKFRTIDINVPSVSWLKRGSLSCCLVGEEGETTLHNIQHIGKNKYRISFIPTQPGFHHIKVQVKGEKMSCNPSTILVLPSPIRVSQTKHIHTSKSTLGIAITSDGLMLVTEHNSQTIAVLNKEGCVIKRFQHQGGGSPIDICVTPDNHILVLSSHAPHITKYTMDYTLADIASTSYGNGQQQFDLPQGIAASTSGLIYVCDTNNHRIQVLNPDLTVHSTIGKKGTKLGQFIFPCGIAIDSQDALYVCDYGNNRIQKLSSNGVPIGKFKVASHPRCVATDHNNMIYMIDNTAKLFLHDSDGYILGYQESNGRNGLAVDKQGHIHVCNGNSTITIFSGMYD